MLIYKVFLEPEWAHLKAVGETSGAPIDLSDGYIHFSTAEQLRETVSKHFAGKPDLILATIETAPLETDIKWEVSRGGAKFPHLHRKLKLSEVVTHSVLPQSNGGHILPKEIP